MYKSNKQFIVFIFLCFAAISLSLVNRVLADDGQTVKINKDDTVTSAQRRDIKQVLVLAGSINSDQIANVKFQTSGRLAWVGVRVGDRVKKGQALASLDKAQLQKTFQKEINDYLTGYNNFLDGHATYQTQKDNSLITDEIKRILENTQYSLNNIVLDYEIAELAVKYATIYSPIDGIVTAITEPVAGVNIISTTTSFTVVDPSALYFSAEIDQEDVVNINLNQAATIYLDSFADSEIASAVSFISFNPIASASTTSYEIRFPLTFDNQDLGYRLGMTGDVSLTIAQVNDTLSLPIDALYDDGGASYVLVKSGKQAQQTPIDIGLESDDYVQILSGITDNDQIVIQK